MRRVGATPVERDNLARWASRRVDGRKSVVILAVAIVVVPDGDGIRGNTLLVLGGWGAEGAACYLIEEVEAAAMQRI